MKIINLVICLILISATFSVAQTVTVDLSKIGKDARNEIIDSQKKQESTPENVKSWVGVGREIGKAIDEMAKSLNTNINEFAKTPVGKTAMFLLVYKVIGRDIARTVMIFIIYTFVVILLIWSFRKFHMTEKIEVKDKDGNMKIQFVPRYNWESGEAKMVSAGFHTGIFVVITFITIINIL